jgi:hypothetical protein
MKKSSLQYMILLAALVCLPCMAVAGEMFKVTSLGLDDGPCCFAYGTRLSGLLVKSEKKKSIENN